jgi:DNA repair exonuclease SbcCD ATPase subunit
MFDSIVPVLDELSRKYSEILTSGSIDVQFNTVTALKSGELRDKFSVAVLNKYGSVDYKGDSGGERRKVDLIIMFALHSLAKIRSGSTVDILFLDEILDSLDQEGCNRVIDLLKQVSETIKKIFVITHNDNLKQMFGSVMRIEKRNGISKLVNLQ